MSVEAQWKKEMFSVIRFKSKASSQEVQTYSQKGIQFYYGQAKSQSVGILELQCLIWIFEQLSTHVSMQQN